MAEFTKKGHKLELDAANPLIFRCRSRAVWQPRDTPRKSDDYWLAAMLIYAPCTAGHMTATLRAWLSVYADAELLEQVEEVVQKALDGMSPVPVPTPSTPPEPGQGQGQRLN